MKRKRTQKGPRPRRTRPREWTAWLTLFAFFVSPATALADETTTTAIGDATTGDGVFTENTGNRTTFDQDTRNAVVRWDVMDQHEDHTLTFIQQSDESVLNQASGIQMSVFRGMVVCEASCVFANEAGILFADSSYLDVGRLAAIAGNVNEDAFRRGELHATELFGTVENLGTIHAGGALLAGARVLNRGEIVIDDGTLTAVVGDELWVRDHDSNVTVRTYVGDRETEPAGDGGPGGIDFGDEPAIENSGTIDAGRGQVRMLAGDMLSYAIRNTGRIEARKVRLEAGEGGLVEVSGGGVIDVSNKRKGKRGGRIDILGDYVAIADDARLDASGRNGGGRIRIGGALQGGGDTRTALQTFLGEDTVIHADAIKRGDGGTIIVWSDGTTESHGTLTARGGERSGDGGFVETSGRAHLIVTDAPEVYARSGRSRDRGGEWLLDPFDIEIVDGAAECGGDCSLDDELTEAPSYDPDVIFSPTIRGEDDTTPSQIDVALLKEALGGGADVTLTTTGSGSDEGDDVGDISLLTDLTFTTADGVIAGTRATLTLLAANDILIDGEIDAVDGGTNVLQLDLDFRANAEGQDELAAGDGELAGEYFGDLQLNGNIETGGGRVDLSGANVQLDGNITTDGGRVSVLAEGGDVTLANAIDTTAMSDPDANGGSVTIGAFQRVADDPTDDSDDPDQLALGGLVLGEAGSSIASGGGTVTLSGGDRNNARRDDAAGGRIEYHGMIDSGDRGLVTLEASRTLTVSNAANRTGDILLGESGSILTDRGNVTLIATVDSASAERSDQATVVRVLGDIDSDSVDSGDDRAGGSVEIRSSGFQVGRIEIGDSDDADLPEITTGGGDIDIISAGTISVLEGTIDAREDTPSDDISGDVLLNAFRGMSIRPEGNDIVIAADENVILNAGADGVARLSIDTTDEANGTSGVTLSGESIDLRAGDGRGGEQRASIDLSLADDLLQLTGRAGSGNPLDFAVIQDADLDASDIPTASQFDSGAFDVTNLTLRSSDGVLDVGGVTATASDTMLLSASEGIEATTPAALSAARLEIENFESLVVDDDLADAINDANADIVEITAGRLAGELNDLTGAEARLTISATLDRSDGNDIERLLLHSGAGGVGDLVFTDAPTLSAEDIRLWAGDGGSVNETAAVFAIEDGTGTVDFDFGAATEKSFTLRQSASIDQDTIPEATQFAGGISGVNYSLRSDGGMIGGDDPIQISKLEDTFLALHARDGIGTDFADGTDPEDLTVRGLDIGGTVNFTYTRAHNDNFVLSNAGGDVALTIRAGLAGGGILGFDGTPEAGDERDFEIVADEIRLVAGDGLAGGNEAIVLLDADDPNRPQFVGPGDTRVDLFVLRQDNPITASSIASTEDFFGGVAPDVHVLHSDYDNVADGNTNAAAIGLIAGNAMPTAASKLILSGESVIITSSLDEDLDVWSLFAETEPTAVSRFELEIRTSTLDLSASDEDDLTGPAAVVLDPDLGVTETTLTISDFERFQSDDDAAEFTPVAFDPDDTPATVPTTVSIQQDATIERDQLTALRSALNNASLDVHDGDPEDPNADAMLLFLESNEGDVELAAASIEGSALDIALHADGATVDWDRTVSAVYDLDSLVITADHSFELGSGDTTPTLDITVDSFLQVSAGAGGEDGDIAFAPDVAVTANQIALRAGVDGRLAGDGESPAVDLTTNTPSFTLKDSEDAEEPDSIFEVRQDAGFVDDIALIGDDGESLILDPTQLSVTGGATEIGVIRFVSEGGSITVSDLSTTFPVLANGGLTRNLDLEAGTVDVLRGGVIEIRDESALDTDTNLTVYEAFDLAAREIRLLADGDDTVRAGSDSVQFRVVSTNLGEGLRFRIQHEDAAISECETGCGDGSIASVSQFGVTSTSDPVDYELVSEMAGVEITEEIAAKLQGGNNDNPLRVDLFLDGNDTGSDADVVFSAQRAGRAIDAQFASLVIGEVNDPVRVKFAGAEGDPVSIATSGDQVYYGEVEIEGDAAIAGDRIAFSEDIRSDDEARLTLNVRDEVVFSGDIDLVRDATGRESLLRVNFDPSQGGIARATFDQDGNDQSVTADRVEFFATRERDLAEGDGFFPSNARRSPTATIGKRRGDLSFDTTRFQMGRGEKLTVGGDLAIGDADTVLASLGDLSAVTIEVIADSIELLLRRAGEYVGFDGQTRRDGGVDYVANTIEFDGEISTRGSGRAPVFGLEDPYGAPSNLDDFILAEIDPDGDALRASDFAVDIDGALVDLHPEGATRDDFTAVFDNELTDPSIVPAFATHLGDPMRTTQNALLSRIDIAVEPDRPATLRRRLDGAGIVDDVGGDLPNRADRRVKVSSSRVLARDAQEVADRHLRLFGPNNERADEVRAVLQAALDDYLLESGARRVLGFEFRRYLRNRPSSQFDAYLALEDLDALFSYHRNLGLTPGEYSRIQARWLATIKPEGISLEQFAEAVHPSRFVRGSDILDVFGD